MSMRLNVGLSKKVGEANYGSRGASVNLDLELDSALVMDSAKLQERIHQLFSLVRTSLEEELSGHGNANGQAVTTPEPSPAPPAPSTNGNGSGRSRVGGERLATPAQVKALYGITRRLQVDLHSLLRDRCRVERPEDLTLRQASGLIDTFQASDGPPRN